MGGRVGGAHSKVNIPKPFAFQMASTAFDSIESNALPSNENIGEIISLLREMPIGESFCFRTKIKSVNEEWSAAKALKGDGFFEIFVDAMGELPKKVLFDDEGESLLSENLWQLGWFATKTEVPVVVEDSNSSAVIFSGIF